MKQKNACIKSYPVCNCRVEKGMPNVKKKAERLTFKAFEGEGE